MARTRMTIEEKIERQKDVVSRIKDKYDAALDELDRLMQRRDEQNRKKILDAYEKGTCPADEIVAFIKSYEKSDENDE